jgi:Cu+-exporting ATPase
MAAVTEKGSHADLAISGMTCASCAVRIERRLNKLEGVAATVNFATERASVSFDTSRVALADVMGAVEAAGYHASVPEVTTADDDPARPFRARLALAAVLSVPVALLAWAPSLRFPGWEWVSLALATASISRPRYRL